MTETDARRIDVSGAGPLEYPTNRMIGTFDRDKLGSLVPDLIDAGFAPIGILAGEGGLQRLRGTGGGDGIDGILRRVAKSLGGDLEYMAGAEKELVQGAALVDVPIVDDKPRDLARDVFARHGGRRITHFRPWTIQPL